MRDTHCPIARPPRRSCAIGVIPPNPHNEMYKMERPEIAFMRRARGSPGAVGGLRPGGLGEAALQRRPALSRRHNYAGPVTVHLAAILLARAPHSSPCPSRRRFAQERLGRLETRIGGRQKTGKREAALPCRVVARGPDEAWAGRCRDATLIG